jgi:putative hemolysin
MNGIALNIGLVLLFVLIGGFFSASELALVSLRDSQVARLAERSRRGARVAALRQDSNRFLASVQIGVTLAGFFSAAYGGSTLAAPLASVLASWGLSDGVADTVALVLVTVAISYLSLVLGELVPKRLALQRAEAVALFAAPVLERIATISRPVIGLLSVSTNAVVRLLGLDPEAANEQVSEEELRDMVSGHEDLGVEERRVLAEVFEAADRQLREVMVPRIEVHFLRASMSLEDAGREVADQPHSRYPVIGESVDDVVGFIHVRDLLTVLLSAHEEDEREQRTVEDIMRPVHVLPNSKALLPALAEMRAEHVHLAVVIDEYGGTDGIVTMEDMIEELVGEIEDEFDVQLTTSADSSDDTVLDGLSHRDEVRERTGIELPDGPFETLGGFIQFTLGRVPAVGDTVELQGRRLIVAAMDRWRVASVRVV